MNRPLLATRPTRTSSWRQLWKLCAPSVALLIIGAQAASATSPVFTLSPPSPSLAAIPATAGTVLGPAIPPIPGPIPPPVVRIPPAALGLVGGDVVNNISFGQLPYGGAPG